MNFTDCECEAPGWCPRHQFEKSKYQFGMCRLSVDHFEQWESGEYQKRFSRGRPQRDPSQTCSHLGPELHTVECPTCAGTVHLKVFACDLHQQCTRLKKIKDIAGCSTCEDFSATT